MYKNIDKVPQEVQDKADELHKSIYKDIRGIAYDPDTSEWDEAYDWMENDNIETEDLPF